MTAARRRPAAASSTAAPGSYKVEVLQLAGSSKVSGGTVSNVKTALGLTGTFTVNGKSIAVAATDTLETVRTKINSANSGLTPMGAIQAATRTAAECLGRSRDLGTVEPGKLADLIVTGGTPSTRISDIRRVELVFKGGVLFEPSRILRATGVND